MGGPGATSVSASLQTTHCLTSYSAHGPKGSLCHHDGFLWCLSYCMVSSETHQLVFFLEPESSGTLKGFFSVVCGTGCQLLEVMPFPDSQQGAV